MLKYKQGKYKPLVCKGYDQIVIVHNFAYTVNNNNLLLANLK